MIKLTKTQSAVAKRMVVHEWHSAYSLQCSIATLNALTAKGVVRKTAELGSFSCPRTSILFKLKPNFEDKNV